MIKGKAWVFRDNVNTDAIIPARFLNTSDEKELAEHCMEDIDAGFAEKASRGDIIVAGTNFGCGSSREHAPVSIKAAGVGCVIAKSFARIFFRNCINIGLPILECEEAVDNISSGDEIEIDLSSGIVKNITKSKACQAKSFPDFMQEIINKGGLMNWVKSIKSQ